MANSQTNRSLLQKAEETSEVLKSCRGAVWSVIFFSMIVNILMLTGPLFMLQVYDRVLASGSIPTLIALVVLVVVLYIIYGVLEFTRSRVMSRVGRRVDELLRSRVFDAVMQHSLKRTPNVGTRPSQDLMTVRQFVGGPGPFAFLDMPWSPVYLAVIFALHWMLGVAALVATLILMVFAFLNDALLRKHVAEANIAASHSANIVGEASRNIEVASALGMTKRLSSRWYTVQQRALDSQTRAGDIGGLLSSITRTMRLMFQSGILALGAYLAVRQEISPGTMIAASIIMSRALAPVEQSFAHWQGFLNARRSWQRIRQVLLEVPAEEQKQPLPAPAGHVSVEGLAAFIPGRQEPLVQGVSFKLKAGSGLGIIGPTGAGKSTIARSLVGLWPHIRGEVRLDGALLSQWDSEVLGSYIGYLPQEVELFEGTIAENIARFTDNPVPESITRAAINANAHELILKLPQGYDTKIGDDKLRLSAGQRQRIGLARALYGEPVLLVLDEPNANLDAEGEAALIKASIEARKRGQTVIIVAHRPSAIQALDQLMMIRDGRVLAFGPRDEVLKQVLANRPGNQGNGNNSTSPSLPPKTTPSKPTDPDE